MSEETEKQISKLRDFNGQTMKSKPEITTLYTTHIVSYNFLYDLITFHCTFNLAYTKKK